MKGVPKKDGSGKGIRLNKGRSGCSEQEIVGKGKLIPKMVEGKEYLKNIREMC